MAQPSVPSANRLDVAGQRFGRLIALAISTERTKSGSLKWICRCDCGTVTVVEGKNLRNGNSTSCGCYRPGQFGNTNAQRHGRWNTPEHRAWRSLRNRCVNPRHADYPKYGGRGITVCPEWDSFERFYADMGPRPSSQHSLDRIDNDGPYSPENCRWATASEQRRNTRQFSNPDVTAGGETLPISEWARRSQVHVATIRRRLREGWTAGRAVTLPDRRRS